MENEAIIKAIEAICSELGWSSKRQTKQGITLIVCPLQKDEYFSGALFCLSTDPNKLSMYLSYRKKIDLIEVPQKAKTVHQINSTLLNGCIELDIDKGDLRMRDCILYVDEVDVDLNLKEFVANHLKQAIGLLNKLFEN